MNNYKTILKLFAILILLLVVAHIVCFASFYALTVVGGTPLDLRMFLSIAAGMCVSAVVAFRIHQVHIFKPMVGSILTVATALAAGLSILGWFGMNSEFLVVFGATLASFGLCKKGLTWTNSALSFLAEKKQKEDLRVPSHSVQFLAVLFCAGLGLTGLSTIFIVFGIRAGLTSISVAKLAYVIVFIGSVAIACCVCRGEEYKGVKGTFFTQTLCAAGLLYFVASKAVSFFGIKSGYRNTTTTFKYLTEALARPETMSSSSSGTTRNAERAERCPGRIPSTSARTVPRATPSLYRQSILTLMKFGSHRRSLQKSSGGSLTTCRQNWLKQMRQCPLLRRRHELWKNGFMRSTAPQN